MYADLDCGSLCESITDVTSGFKSCQFSHIGIVNIEKGNLTIIEAIGKNVQASKPYEFFSRAGVDEQGKPKVVVGRLKDHLKPDLSNAVEYCKRQVGMPYDDVFTLGEDAFYCSELIYFAFKKEVFLLNVMTFKSDGSSEILDSWQNYFRSKNAPIPEGELGINPGAMSRSLKQEIVHFYGIPDKCVF